MVVDGGVASDVVDLTADRELQAALEASMEDYGKLNASGTDTDADLKAVLAASLEEIEGGDASIFASSSRKLAAIAASMDASPPSISSKLAARTALTSASVSVPDPLSLP